VGRTRGNAKLKNGTSRNEYRSDGSPNELRTAEKDLRKSLLMFLSATSMERSDWTICITVVSDETGHMNISNQLSSNNVVQYGMLTRSGPTNLW
jgi:hypothetical protein